MKQSGGKKILIPAYKDMDPYDLPEEFSHLQAQDMSKLGFMQDLIRGIKKLAQTEASAPTPIRETVVVNTSSNANVAPLLERAFLYLEDGNWESADEYCEKVLDLEPKNARAYLGKLLAELNCYDQASLRDKDEPFDDSDNYEKIMRFGDAALRKQMEDDIASIEERIEQAEREKEKVERYEFAINAMNTANTEDAFKKAAEQFAAISGFLEADAKKVECQELAEITRKQKIYNNAQTKQKKDTITTLEQAIQLYTSIPDWKNANEQALICQSRIVAIKAEQEYSYAEEQRCQALIAEYETQIAELHAQCQHSQQSAMQKELEIVQLQTQRKGLGLFDGKRKKEIDVKISLLKSELQELIDCTGTQQKDILDKRYQCAQSLKNNTLYTAAIVYFNELKGYKDSEEQIRNCNTAIAEQTQNRENESKYNYAIMLLDTGIIIEAYEALRALNGYKNSAELADSIYRKYKIEKLNHPKVGDCVFFGAYKQLGANAKDLQNIEWIVLDVQDGRALVISKYALECRRYNNHKGIIAWETCTLRSWLNNSFIRVAFSAAEQARIPTVQVSADNTYYGNATLDRIFLLSINEVKKYLGSYNERSIRNLKWWLRTPSSSQEYAFLVKEGGGISECYATCDTVAVRPALWIDLTKE